MNWSRFRRCLLTAHLWAGLILAIPFILLGLSGSLLMLQPELPRMSYPYATGRGEMQSVTRILNAASLVAPDSGEPSRIILPQRTGEPAILRYGPRGDRKLVFVDPVTLEILGVKPQFATSGIFTPIRTLHATLYLHTYSDKAFVGWVGIAITLLALSGLILWWPKKGQWSSAFGMKRGARGYRLNRDLHSMIGFWTSSLYLVVSISGIYLAFPSEFRDLVGRIFPMGTVYDFPESADAVPRPPEEWLGPDDVVSLALASVNDARLVAIDLAQDDNPVAVVTLAPANYGIGAPPVTVSIDTEIAQVSYTDDPRQYFIGDRIVTWQRYLHSGLGLGFFWRVLVFFSGFLPLLFAVTGVRMWWLKRGQRRAPRLPASITAPAE